MATTTFYEVPNKLEARNFEELRVLMLGNNMRLGGKVIYDIHPPTSSKAKWYAFFYEKMEAQQVMKEQLNELSR
jgi:hypothetical protein